MKRILIIGIGNRTMKDDGIGVAIVEFLKTKIKYQNVQIIVGETDIGYCLNRIHPDDFLFIIDSMYGNGQPGGIRIFPLKRENLNNKSYLQHEMSLLNSLSLYFRGIQGYIIGIEVAEIGFGFELSEELKFKLESICNRVNRIVEKIMEKNGLKGESLNEFY